MIPLFVVIATSLAATVVSAIAFLIGMAAARAWLRWRSPRIPIWEFQNRACRECGCTDLDCSGCFERTGSPCYWFEPDLCSACALPHFEGIVSTIGPGCQFPTISAWRASFEDPSTAPTTPVAYIFDENGGA